MPPWINPWLLAAEAVSFGLHFLILYVPALANIFGIVPLSFQEWLLVILFASPVILIDEVRSPTSMCCRSSLVHHDPVHTPAQSSGISIWVAAWCVPRMPSGDYVDLEHKLLSGRSVAIDACRMHVLGCQTSSRRMSRLIAA